MFGIYLHLTGFDGFCTREEEKEEKELQQSFVVCTKIGVLYDDGHRAGIPASQPTSIPLASGLDCWLAGWMGGMACNASISRLDWWWSIIIIWKQFPINHFCLLLSAPPASAPPGSSIVFIRSLLCAHNAVTSWFDPVSAKHRWGVWCLWLNHKDEEEEEKPTGTGYRVRDGNKFYKSIQSRAEEGRRLQRR